jgi:hypothetical protein
MSEHDSTEIKNIGNYPIKPMFIELAQLDDWLHDPSIEKKEDDCLATVERHLALREQIGATPARSLAELAFKAHTLKIDAECERSWPKLAEQLAQSLADDVLRLAGHTQ